MIRKVFFIATLVVAGVWGFNATHQQCVNVYVDFNDLLNHTIVKQCVAESETTPALEVLGKANIDITGTEKYGNQVVCRVMGLPNAGREKCIKMPPENAYWAVIIKKHSAIPTIGSSWNWAQTGIADVKLNPGDSLGLVFTENGKVRWPS